MHLFQLALVSRPGSLALHIFARRPRSHESSAPSTVLGHGCFISHVLREEEEARPWSRLRRCGALMEVAVRSCRSRSSKRECEALFMLGLILIGCSCFHLALERRLHQYRLVWSSLSDDHAKEGLTARSKTTSSAGKTGVPPESVSVHEASRRAVIFGTNIVPLFSRVLASIQRPLCHVRRGTLHLVAGGWSRD